MSAAEMVGRAGDIVRKAKWRRRSDWEAPRAQLNRIPTWHWPQDIDPQNGEARAVIQEADRSIRGDYGLLNIEFHEDPLDWHRDPASGRRAPCEFGPDIDYRDPNVVGSAKNIWEKSRHHHLTVAALAYALSRNVKYAHYVAGQLRSWVQSNPVPRGITWTSPLEMGVRLIAWVWIDRLLRGSDPHAGLFGESGFLWPSVYWHQWMLSQHRSRGSSANNHLIGEAAGLFIAATAWPVFEESGNWEQLARGVLEREIVRQTFASGLNRELGFAYHLFAAEFFLLCGVEYQRAGRGMSAQYCEYLRRILQVIAPLCDVKGTLPHFGDEDDGMAVQLQPSGASRVDWLYRVGRVWPGARVPQPTGDSGALVAGIVWPLRSDATAPPAGPPEGCVALTDAGVYVLASARGTPDEVFCLCDAGPLGFLSIAAHGHADALSFTLSAGGQPIIVDAGTYVYHADRAWRDYFRGTRAHNTITLNAADQSEPGGIFMWVRKAQTQVLEWEPAGPGGRLVAEHDGYTRLAGRPIHRRSFELQGKRLRILDQVRGSGHHELEWRLHFHPACAVSVGPGEASVRWAGGRMEMQLDRRLDWRVEHGGHDAGWFSPRFNQKTSCPTLIGKLRTSLPASLENTLEICHGD
jgi:hypothetical protein